MERVLENLEWRYACKAFDASKKITEKDFNTLLEALRLTASSYGLQPWKFIVVENEKLRAELVASSWNQKQVQEASHLIVFTAPKVIDEAFIDSYVSSIAKTRGQEISELEGYKKMMMSIVSWTPEVKHQWAKNQSYIALGNLLNVCADMRIDSCPMEGFKASDYDRLLELDKLGLTSMVVCPVGYRSEQDSYAKLTKVRHSLADLVIKL